MPLTSPSPEITHGKLCHVEVFDTGNPLVERNARWAIALTVATMIAEIACGWFFNSMALLADGWHMSSHALALGLSVCAYAAARRFARDARFAFGTWKIEVLGGYTSAILLVGVALAMLAQSVERLLSPTAIRYDEAMAVAILGLLVNLACAWLLHEPHSHSHAHPHSADAHGHAHKHKHTYTHHHDLNQRSAYLHVVADAATSVLAIAALAAGKFWNAAWMDPAMGIAGALLVARWARSLIVETGRVLLDAEMDNPLTTAVRRTLATLPADVCITDLHLWRVGKARYACVLSLNADTALQAEDIRHHLRTHRELAHITVEINRHSGTNPAEGNLRL